MNLRWLLLRDAPDLGLEALLSPEELAEGARFRHPGRRRQWALGRVAAKTLAAEALGGLDPGGLRVRRGPRGAPELCDPLGQPLPLQLSIAHTADLALAAAAPSAGPALGVDLECVEPHSQAFLEDHYTREERRWLAGLEPGARWCAATLAWTVKEATLKALGVGLGAAADSVSVGPCVLDHAGGWRPVPARLGQAVVEAAWRPTPDGACVMAWARLPRA